MTGLTDEDRLARAERALAHEAAADLLAEAFEEARVEAKSILRGRLVDTLLQEVSDLGEPSSSRPSPIQLQGTDEVDTESSSVHRGLYVYGFTLPNRCDGSDLRGVNGSLTSAIVEDDVAAIVSEVSGKPSTWGVGPDGDADLDGLASRAREHELVLEAIMGDTPVLPMRFGTLYPSAEAVREVLRSHQSIIHGAIIRLEGKTEFGLTVTWDGRYEEDLANDDLTGLTGRSYLSRREAQKAAAERLTRDRREVAIGLHRAIDVVAAASVVHPTRHPSQSDGSDQGERDVLLRASYLVEPENRDCFEKTIVEALESGSDLGLSGDLTGPWPPYNFSRLDLNGAHG